MRIRPWLYLAQLAIQPAECFHKFPPRLFVRFEQTAICLPGGRIEIFPRKPMGADDERQVIEIRGDLSCRSRPLRLRVDRLGRTGISNACGTSMVRNSMR